MRSLNNAPWIVRAGAEGRLFGAHMGTVTTPLTASAASIAAKRPQAWIRIPNGTLVVPVSVRIQVEASGATIPEIALASTTNDVGNGTSAAADGAPANKNTGSANTSLVTARQLASADVTTETGYLEHQRFTAAASITGLSFNWPTPGADQDLPFLRGPASWLLYIGLTSGTFFAQFSWVEYDEAAT